MIKRFLKIQKIIDISIMRKINKNRFYKISNKILNF